MVNWKSVRPYDFEKIIGQLYEKLGYNVLVCQATRDKGVDVFVKKYLPEYDRYEFFVIQAKKWIRKVGIDEVQRLSGVIASNHATAGILIITSDFSSDAYTQAMTLKNVELMNKKSLERKLAEVGIIDFEEIDLDTNEIDQFAKINQLLKILKECPNGSMSSQVLLETLKRINEIDENAFSELLIKLVKVNRVILDSNNVLYIPSKKEKSCLEEKIISEFTSLSSIFPFDLDFFRAKISKITNLSPEIIQRCFDISSIISKLVASKEIIELSGKFFINCNLIEKIKSKLPNKDEYDVFDITDASLLNSFKEAKKQYNSIGQSELKALEAFSSLGKYFDQFLTTSTLIVLFDFERFIVVKDQRILQVTETLLVTSDSDGLNLERGNSLLKFNYESNLQIFGCLILEVCKKHNTHISSNKLKVKEMEY